ncbi:MAG: hypothetical protein HY225_01530 [Candidatus Vogelbacteria bacterium]|nr:hypothetical protein [Candidatus Vogelbacteria bacterium]
MTEDQKIKKLIEESFLTSEQKRFLVQYIDLKGIDMKFVSVFNQYLEEATENQDDKYELVLKKIKEAENTLDKRATTEKSRIEERLEQELSNIDPLDLKTKGRIWEEYYDTLDELGERYNRGLRDMLSKIIVSI